MSARRRRSTLFVAGLRLDDDLAAALDSGADVVCIDLEDAVPPGRKAEARTALAASLPALALPPGVLLSVRVNGLRSADGLADLQACLAPGSPVGALLVPKPESADELRWAGELADEAAARAAAERPAAGAAAVDLELHAIVETPAALECAPAIARAHPRVAALYFGGFDLSTALGCTTDWEPLLYARSRVVHAAAIGAIEAIDSPWQDVGDAAGLADAAARARRLGMAGKVTKAASQVAAINAAFTPGAAELERAVRVVARFDAAPGEPLVVDGKLIELPTIKRLRAMVERFGGDPRAGGR